MQLKKKKVHESIRGALALATCSLVSPVPTQAADDPSTGGWDVESALLYYSEKDRVSVIEPVFSARKETGDDEYLTVHGVLDSMTGASPNGATITNKPQTFTTASGSVSKTTVPANELPKAPFNDFRISLGLDWAQPVTRTSRNTMGASLSVESDYTSLGGSYTHLWDFNNRLTTLTAGLGLSFDSVSPKGGAPTPLQRLSAITAAPVATVTAASGGGEGGEGIGLEGKTKFIADVVFGVTQVLTPRALMQLNYSHGYHNGYMTDPYKLVSMIDATGDTADYIFESRPGIRNSNSLYWKWVYHLPEDVIHLSHRYFWDSWGVVSRTTEFTYRFEVTHGLFLEPYGRYYTQTAADFYRHSLSNTAAIPAYVSADYRLAEMKSRTTGLKLGLADGENSEWSLTVERMVQTGNSHPADAIGIQQNFDLYPKLEANIIQLNYFAKF